MRIAHISDCYLPRLGGIEVQVHSLAQHQLAAGHVVEVITATPPARHDRTSFEVVDGVPVRRLTIDLPFELPVYPRVGREITALLEQARRSGAAYDAVHLHTGVISPFAYGALPALIRAGVPTVVTVHSMWGSPWGPARLTMRLAHAMTRWSRWPIVVSAVSSAAASAVREVAGPGVPVRVIANGIDPAQWVVDPEPRTPQDDVLLVAVMRMAPRKRCLPLLRMLEQVREQLPASVGLRAMVIGDGPRRGAMRRYLRRHAMADWVQLPGRWERPAIRELYRRADLFVAPADLESFGIAALEARTAGLPVIAKAGTGVGEFVVDTVEGVLAPTDHDLVAALVALAGSAPRRAAMAEHNRAVAPSTTWPAVLAQCEAAYAAAQELVRARRG